MEKFVLIIHVLAALGVTGLVLLQHGKGADMGAAFGSGASGSLFGVSGSSNFMSKATAGFVAVFFTTSLTLTYLASHKSTETSVVKMPVKAIIVPAPAPASVDKSKTLEPKPKEVPQ